LRAPAGAARWRALAGNGQTKREATMDLGLRGRRALVTGASRGLGAGIAAALAAEGCDLVLAARSADRLTLLGRQLADAHGVRVESTMVDFGDIVSVEALAEAARRSGAVDILVANTGGPPPTGALGVAAATWQAQFQSMVLGVIRLVDLLVPAMRARGWGRVVTIASSGVIQPIPTLAMSNTLRASVVAFMKTLAGEVAADGVTVNVLAPGRIATERTEELDTTNAARAGVDIEEMRRRSVATIPAGRYGAVEEFASVACFLCGAPASYVTGAIVRVDGGLIRAI
jgi:3-oxoacyl-[acyl-carrier protein] reductase